MTVLSRVADGLNLRLSELLASVETDRVVVRRRAQQESVQENGWRRTILTPVVPGVNFEWLRTTLPPHTDAGAFPAYAPGSHQFVVVHMGTLHLTVGETTYELDAGTRSTFPPTRCTRTRTAPASSVSTTSPR